MSQMLQRQMRFVDIARAFAVLATNPDKIVIEDETIRTCESTLHNITHRMNGDPLAAQVETLLSHPFETNGHAIEVRPNGNGQAKEPPDFKWTKIGDRGAPDTRFVCAWQGLALEVKKAGPANYIGAINTEVVVHGKFKANVRERLQKEAAKRANA